MDHTFQAIENFQTLVKKKGVKNYNTPIQVIHFITEVVEFTSQELKKRGTILTGREKYELCCAITEQCIQKLFESQIIDEKTRDEVLEQYRNVTMYAEVVSGIVSIGKSIITDIKSGGCCAIL